MQVDLKAVTASLNVPVVDVENLNTDGRPELPTLIETIAYAFPNVPVYARGDAYSDLVFENPDSVISESALAEYRLNYAKYLYIERSFEQANRIQEAATSYHTISKTTTMVQTDVYRMKHDEALNYVIRCEQVISIGGDYSVVTVPAFIKNESDLVGQDPYELAIAVIQNYNASNDSLKSYFGSIEGERRLLKRRILEATTLTELVNVQWADWPAYQPTTSVDLEA